MVLKDPGEVIWYCLHALDTKNIDWEWIIIHQDLIFFSDILTQMIVKRERTIAMPCDQAVFISIWTEHFASNAMQ